MFSTVRYTHFIGASRVNNYFGGENRIWIISINLNSWEKIASHHAVSGPQHLNRSDPDVNASVYITSSSILAKVELYESGTRLIAHYFYIWSLSLHVGQLIGGVYFLGHTTEGAGREFIQNMLLEHLIWNILKLEILLKCWERDYQCSNNAKMLLQKYYCCWLHQPIIQGNNFALWSLNKMYTYISAWM